MITHDRLSEIGPGQAESRDQPLLLPLSAHSTHAHDNKKGQEIQRTSPLSLFTIPPSAFFFFFAQNAQAFIFQIALSISCDRKNDRHGLKWSSCKTAVPSKWIVSLPVINKIYFTTNTQRVSPLHKTRAMTCWCPVWDLVSHIISLTSPQIYKRITNVTMR